MIWFYPLADVAGINVIHAVFSYGGPVDKRYNSVDSTVVSLVSCCWDVVCFSKKL